MLFALFVEACYNNNTLFLYKYDVQIDRRKYYIVYKNLIYQVYPSTEKFIGINYLAVKDELIGFEELSRQDFFTNIFSFIV